MNCRHCKRCKASRARGLCWGCSLRPDVRALYPSASKYAARGIGHGGAPVVLPAEPTAAPTGTEAKLRVMRERAARRECLFHPADNPECGVPPDRGNGVRWFAPEEPSPPRVRRVLASGRKGLGE